MILGLVGRARVGKDTCAKAITLECQARGLSSKIYSLSGLVLDHCIEHTYIKPNDRESLQPPEIAILVREGMEMRKGDPDYWISRMVQVIHEDSFAVAVIPNIRFKNEADYIRLNHGTLVRIERRNADGSEFISTDRNPNHESETQQKFIATEYWVTAGPNQQDLLEDYALAILDHVLLKGEVYA